MTKNCGTCGRWGGPDAKPTDHSKECRWTKPPMPFWAEEIIDLDGEDWTSADNGKDCPVWAAKEEMA